MSRIVILFLLTSLIWNSCSSIKEPSFLLSDRGCSEDVFQYMETDSARLYDWVMDQDLLASSFFDEIPFKDTLIQEIDYELWSGQHTFLRFQIIDDETIFFLGSLSREEDYSVYRFSKSTRQVHKILDPSSFQNNPTINYFKIAPNSEIVAVGVSDQGEEFSTIFLYDLVKSELLPYSVPNAFPTGFGGINWLKNSNSFLYTYIPDIDESSANFLKDCELRLCDFDETGLKCTNLFSAAKFPELNLSNEDYPLGYLLDADEQILLCAMSSTSRFRDTYWTKIDMADLENLTWQFAWDKKEKIKFFENNNNQLYYTSAQDNENFEIRKTNIPSFDFNNFEVVVPADSSFVIDELEVTNNKVLYVKIKDGVNAQLSQLGFEGLSIAPDLPYEAGALGVTTSNLSSLAITSISGWTSAEKTFIYDTEDNSFVSFIDVDTKTSFQDYEIRQLIIKGHDDVDIPLSVVYKAGLQLDGSAPVLMNAYGAYGHINEPRKSEYLKSWCDRGGILAWAHVRGGGEKGAVWHEKGRKENKANSWKDLISCSEYLIENKFTSAKNIVVHGVSAGAITVGNAWAKRPDLYAGAVIERGLLNMTKLEASLYGKGGVEEFGSVENPQEYEYLCEMDVYHNLIQNESYPPIYLIAGMNDTRAAPWMSSKIVAKLQMNTTNLAILDIDYEGGHGPVTYDRYLQEASRIMGFSLKVTGHPDFQSKDP